MFSFIKKNKKPKTLDEKIQVISSLSFEFERIYTLAHYKSYFVLKTQIKKAISQLMIIYANSDNHREKHIILDNIIYCLEFFTSNAFSASKADLICFFSNFPINNHSIEDIIQKQFSKNPIQLYTIKDII